ncbi:hypothetical protein PPERSA_12186 [Pseudocohnilembus persalinus]|uniref:Uncharacterized protein n=1 Tax=Pseudocohnilembus persalinus TaxID=266149 RepID=A0A0V0R8N5_PSEPJ|nr:hypothetical protein PPERSA_12186 [Pseudocohnilembus persalinus]|eukprot:KRX10835.1 hypothetical protein PPERSA_12186 [Pseudocohnilembus persalinus]
MNVIIYLNRNIYKLENIKKEDIVEHIQISLEYNLYNEDNIFSSVKLFEQFLEKLCSNTQQYYSLQDQKLKYENLQSINKFSDNNYWGINETYLKDNVIKEDLIDQILMESQAYNQIQQDIDQKNFVQQVQNLYKNNRQKSDKKNNKYQKKIEKIEKQLQNKQFEKIQENKEKALYFVNEGLILIINNMYENLCANPHSQNILNILMKTEILANSREIYHKEKTKSEVISE